MIQKTARGWMQIVSLEEGTAAFDVAFWQAQTPEARWAAGWDLARLAHFVKGGSEDELRLQRTPVVVQKISG